MSTFQFTEKDLPDTSFVNELQGCLAKLQGVTGLLSESVQQCSEKIERWEISDNEVTEGFKDQAGDFVDSAASEFDEFRQQCQQYIFDAITALDSQLESFKQRSQTLDTDWKEKHSDCEKNVDEFNGRLSEKLDQLQQKHAALAQKIKESVSQHARAIELQRDDLVQFRDALAQEITNDYTAAATTFSTNVNQTHAERWAGEKQAKGDQWLQQIDLFGQTGDGACQQFNDDLSGVMTSFSLNVKDNSVNLLKKSGTSLVKGATQKVAEEVTESVVLSEVGASVTGAMAPYLPTMVVIKKVSDTLLDAIEIWKKLKDPF